jgi:arsenate reductase (glutaredoxin)
LSEKNRHGKRGVCAAFFFESRNAFATLRLCEKNMNKVYHLSSCSTCQRIIKELDLEKRGFVFQDIKSDNIDAETLDQLAKEHGSYEVLFSKRAMKFRGEGLHEKTLSESDLRKLILEEYTFLKRPVIFIGTKSFFGNSKKVVEAAMELLNVD